MKTYTVELMEHRLFSIDVQATSAEKAARLAKELYELSQDPREQWHNDCSRADATVEGVTEL